jgi:hypothetical protein
MRNYSFLTGNSSLPTQIMAAKRLQARTAAAASTTNQSCKLYASMHVVLGVNIKF